MKGDGIIIKRYYSMTTEEKSKQSIKKNLTLSGLANQAPHVKTAQKLIQYFHRLL